ncbi:MAG: aryl-sulfate sulfotransferase [Erysipelotrichaceae bacterium]|nr:aryl-sulfate sulfotransferase [Erysipelotrichaceae bacterium]
MSEKIGYEKIEHIIFQQNKAEKAMLEEFHNGDYSLDNPLVKYNAYLVNPLSAVVLFNTEKETAITIRVLGKTKEATISHTFPKTKEHILPILGLYSDYENTIEIEAYRGQKTTIKIDVPDVYNGEKVINYMKTSAEYLQDNLIFVSPAGEKLSSAFDFNGDARWHMTIPCVFDLKRLKNGNLIIGSSRLIKMPYYMSGIYEMSLVGKSGSWTDADWFHNNAVWYDENTNSLTFSGRHIDSMCNIDFDTGKLNWIIGDPEMWPEEYQKYFFTPVGDGEFDWQYEQHANVILPDGDVMCFDNGHFRSKVPEKRILNKDNFSRGVRYRINTDDMTIKQIWQYGKERGQEFYSQYICNVEYYGEGHYMVHSGGIQYYGDDASEEFAAMMQDDPMVRTRSITVEVLDDEVMLELEVKGNFYRAEKLKLYHDGDNLPLGDGVSTGHMGVTKEFDTIIPAEACGEELPYIYEANINEEPDRFTLKATFESGQLVMLMLEQGEEQHGYYISTAKTQFAALCCGTFIEKDARNITCSVNKYGLKGTYDVRVIVDDTKYETGIQITC